MRNRKPNSHECIYKGYKMECTEPEIETNEDNLYICFTKKNDLDNDRIVINLEKCEDNPFYFHIDLEDVLRFAKKNCNGIYERVNNENSSTGI